MEFRANEGPIRMISEFALFLTTVYSSMIDLATECALSQSGCWSVKRFIRVVIVIALIIVVMIILASVLIWNFSLKNFDSLCPRTSLMKTESSDPSYKSFIEGCL